MAITKEQVSEALSDWLESHTDFNGPKDLAAATGLTANVVGKYVRGANLPPPEKARALYRVTGIELLSHLGGAEQSALHVNDDTDHGEDAGHRSSRGEGEPKSQKRGQVSSPPEDAALTRKQCKELLALVDVIRDPIHGDIRLTGLERRLVDTESFQRLRHLYQLGLTSLVYPGAVHTRFAHSLGVLHLCSQMIAICNANATTHGTIAKSGHPIPLTITPYCELLARLCALLHDTAHIPFGHSFEKEGRIIEHDEWNDSERSELLLGPDSEFRHCVRSVFEGHSLPEAAADELVDDIRNVLTTPRHGTWKLSYPFVHDLVGNTICADLLDYVRRDMYYCGLKEGSGDRFLEYLAVLPLKMQTKDADVMADGADETRTRLEPEVARRYPDRETFKATTQGDHIVACRVVLLQYRYNESHVPVVKRDVCAEAIDLIRRRLNVAEKAYFHRTKMVATAMLVSAVLDHDFATRELLHYSDLEVLKRLAVSDNPRAKRLGEAILCRRLYKCIYRVSFRPSHESVSSDRIWGKETGAYEKFKEPRARRELERKIERLIGLVKFENPDAAAGCSCVSCPDARMNVKEFDMLVLRHPDNEIRRLQDSSDPPTEADIKAIQTKHQHLWKLEVYVDPSVVEVKETDELAMDLAGAILGEIGPKNEVREMDTQTVHSFDELIAQEELRIFLKGHGVNPSNLTVGHADALRNMAMKPASGAAGRAREDAMLERLREWGYRE